MRRRRLAAGCLALAVAAGCQQETVEDPAGSSGRLPLSVGVFFDAQSSSATVKPEPDPSAVAAEPGSADGSSTDSNGGPGGGTNGGGVGLQRAQFTGSGREIATAFARALVSDYGLVEHATVIDVPDRQSALSRAGEFDFLLAVGLALDPEYPEPDRSVGWGTLEVVAWLFGGVPAWFVPTMQYATNARLTAHVIDLGGERASGLPSTSRREVVAPPSSMSLWSRAPIGDEPGAYALSILVPPMFLRAGDPRIEGQALTEELLEEMRDEAETPLREEFVLSELESPIRVLFREPSRVMEDEGLSLRVVLDLQSKDRVPLASLEVVRSVDGVETVVWDAGTQDLDGEGGINERLAGRQSVWVSVLVPQTIPAAEGENLIRVRAARKDGVRVTRTTVYRVEE